MPFDAPRWSLEISAADKTAAAFASVNRNMKALQTTERATSTAMTAGFGAISRALVPLATGFAAVAVAQKVWQAGMKAGALGEQAEQIGVTAEALQALRSVALQSGVSTEQLDGSLTKLQRAMGAANDGSDDMIDKFKKLGVQLLDANKQLRAPTDVLPELARGLLNVSNSTERNALMMEIFGKSGTKMNTMLATLAGGMGALTEEARKNGQIVSQETIDAWDKLDDQLTLTKTAASNAFAALGAPIATEALALVSRLLNDILGNLDRLRREAASGAGGARSVAAGQKSDLAVLEDRLTAARQLAQTNNNAMNRSSVAALEKQIAVAREAEAATKLAISVQEDVSGSTRGSGPPERLDFLDRTTGGQPTGSKSKGGGSDPFKAAMESSRDYIAAKKAEQAALGQTAFEAARLTHETELLNKATGEGKRFTTDQTEALKQQAVAMATADAAFAAAKFMDDFKTASDEFIAQQQIERDTLYMGQQAAMAYRIEKEAINRATAAGIALGPQDIALIREKAAAQAASAEQTRKASEWMEFEKATFKGFFSDLNQGLREGANIWDTFGKAAENALGRISDKLLDMALNNLWEAAFPKSAGGGGGIVSGIVGFISSLFGPSGSGITFAGGGTPPVGTPYLVGERGPEVRVDGRPGQIFNRQQWNALTGANLNHGLSASANVLDSKAGKAARGRIFDSRRDMALEAKGAAFNLANVIPFARGDIFNSPTLFPSANGAAGGLSGVTFADGGTPPVGTPYIVGERGPEVRVDGRPGHIFNRQQWNAMGAGGSGAGGRVDIYVHEATDMLRLEIDNRADARIVRATPQLVSSTLERVPGRMAQHRRDEDGGDHRLG